MTSIPVRRCRVCGCTDDDCSQCILRTGRPCTWVADDLCSACQEGFNTVVHVKRSGSDNVASVRIGGRTYRASCTSSGQIAVERLAEKVRTAAGAASARTERYTVLSMKAARAALFLAFELILLACLPIGCATQQPPPTPVAVAPDPVPTAEPATAPAPDPLPIPRPTIRRAVVAGLTRVDLAAYGGWNGACPGCDVDAQCFAILCRDQGLTVTELHNAAASCRGLIAASQAAWADMAPDDLFVLYISGHGGQVPDTSGDEADAMDETVCLWDGELSDDVLRALWEKIPAGVRVFFVTDTCNSGTNYRARPIVPFIPRKYRGELIHYGGCADGLSSYGSAQGGQWTTALIDAWSPSLSYRAWFRAAAKLMPRDQVPYYAEYGPVSDAFRNTTALR